MSYHLAKASGKSVRILAAGLLVPVALVIELRDFALGNELPTIQQLEHEVLLARRSIRSARVDVAQSFVDHSSSIRYEAQVTTHIADGGRLREDFHSQDRNCTLIFADPELIELRYKPGQFDHPDRSYRPTVVMRQLSEVDRNDPRFRTFNPLALMLNSQMYEMAKRYNLEQFINAPERDNLALTSTRWRETTSYLIRFRMVRTGVIVEYEVAPAFGYSVVKFIVGKPTVGQSLGFEHAAVCEPRRDEATGIWFPHLVETKHIEAGRLRREERLTIDVSHINQTIDPELFTVPGLKVPQGTVVSRVDRGGNELLMTADKGVRPITARDIADIEVSRIRTPPSSRRTGFIAGSVGCLLAGLGLWIWAGKRRGTQSKKSGG